MTLLVPVLLGVGALGLAIIGKKKSEVVQRDALTNDAFVTPPQQPPKPLATSAGTVADPTSPASRMAGGTTVVNKLATSNQSPISRGSPPNAPPAVSPVVTIKAPLLSPLSVSNKLLMGRK